MQFEWDQAKAESNVENHGVSFTMAASVFFDPLAWSFPDPDHPYGEMRFLTIGRAADGQLLVVSHVDLDEDRVRIISARRATKRERHDYEEA